MSHEIRIPPDQIPIMKKILTLDDLQKEVILNHCVNYRQPKNGVKIQPIEGFEDFPEIFEFIIKLFRLYHNLHEDQIVENIDDYISQLTNSFIKQLKFENFQFEENFDDKIHSMGLFVKKLLTEDTRLFYYEKAIYLLFERSRLIQNSRIITDIRPIFKDEKIDSPEYCIITHNLKIEYFKGMQERKKAYFALDHQDLLQLQTLIERALEKEAEMQKLCQKMGLDILEV